MTRGTRPTAMPHDGLDEHGDNLQGSIVRILFRGGIVTAFVRRLFVLVLLLSVALLSVPRSVSAQMDPKAVAGIPLPVADVAVGTVVVRVIKGSLTNNVPDQPVELSGAGAPRTVKTDAAGRAEFTGLAPGTRVTAATTVLGERLQSQEFAVPSAGGTRLLLVATDPDTEKRAPENKSLAAAPAQPGVVVLGDQSRFVFEFGDGSLSVFNLLQVTNTAGTPVMPPRPIVFELPAGATGVTILQDSSPQATAAGRTVTVVGPFAPGATNVQFAYSMPYAGAALTIEQTMPVALNRVIVLAQKIADMRLASAQMTEQREMAAEGQTYVVGQGPAIRAGERLTFSFSNLPHEAQWPRYLAVGIAMAILAAGWWGSTRVTGGKGTQSSGQERLEKRRAQLFNELTSLEEQHRAGRVDAQKYAERRASARHGARTGVRGDRSAGGLMDGSASRLRAQGSRLRQEH